MELKTIASALQNYNCAHPPHRHLYTCPLPPTNLVDATAPLAFRAHLGPLPTLHQGRPHRPLRRLDLICGSQRGAQWGSAQALPCKPLVVRTVFVVDPSCKDRDKAFVQQLLMFRARMLMCMSCNRTRRPGALDGLCRGRQNRAWWRRRRKGRERRLGKPDEVQSLQTAHVESVAVLRLAS